MLRKLVREPLIHFLIGGLVLYAAFALRSDPGSTDDLDSVIVVDRRALLTYLQYRANAFEPDTFGELLDSMSDADLQELTDAYVNEELLYREARSLGLESNDYIIRQRMVQKMSFLMSDIADRGATSSEAELSAWFEANIDAYAIAPWTTFTHVFFDSQRRGVDDARRAAEAALGVLNETGTGFNDPPELGDRFAFLRNYVERTYEYVASHFGYDFAAQLAELPPQDNQWQGPIESSLGYHVVLVTKQTPRAYPELDAVRADVERDFEADRTRAALGEMTQSVRDRYRIEIRELRSNTQ